jgi:hypothetical protein
VGMYVNKIFISGHCGMRRSITHLFVHDHTYTCTIVHKPIPTWRTDCLFGTAGLFTVLSWKESQIICYCFWKPEVR